MIHSMTTITTTHPLVTSTVFVKGHEAPELSGTSYFTSGGENLACHGESLEDTISAALDPIRDYLRQCEDLNKGNDMGQINVMNTLEAMARVQLGSFKEAIEKHMGQLYIRKISHGNPGLNHEYKPEQAVAAEILYHDGV